MSRDDVTAEQRVRRLLDLHEILAKVARDLGPRMPLHQVLKTVLDAMRLLVDFKGGTICLVEDDLIRIVASDPPVSPEVYEARLPVGSGLAGRVISEGKAIYSPDLDKDDRVVRSFRTLGSNITLKSYLGVPLISGGQVIGLIQVDSADVDAFDDDDLRLLEGLATQVAGSVQAARGYEQAEKLEALRADFIARVSHELRTPLTIITGFSKTLLARGESFDEEERKRMLEKIDSAAMRLGVLIEELLAVNEFEEAMADPQLKEVHLADLLTVVRSSSASPDDVEIVCDHSVTMVVDPKLLGAAISMLVDNALKYAGNVKLEGHPTEVVVSDRGPGIPSEIRESVFDLFTRGTLSRPGMGLGLNKVRQLALAMGADLVLGDDHGEGTVVRLIFG